MRTAFAQELAKLAQQDERIVLLVGDIGNTLFDDFKKVAPDRFFNCGIAEQNMVSMAAGMAKSGFRPVCFTIAPFLTARCFEQIKIDCGYHNVPVVLAAVGAGLCYANLGPTHQALDDIAILRTIPNLKIAVPCDKADARSALRACLAESGPTYLRLGRDGEPDILGDAGVSFAFGSAYLWHWEEHAHVKILACGSAPASAAQRCVALLDDLEVRVGVCSSIKPLPTFYPNPSTETGRPTLYVTIEEHGLIGGFGAAVAEWMNDHNPHGAKLLRIGCPDEFLHSPMTPQEAREYCGLTPEKIAQRIRDELQRLR